jgi:hypothetical protein
MPFKQLTQLILNASQLPEAMAEVFFKIGLSFIGFVWFYIRYRYWKVP